MNRRSLFKSLLGLAVAPLACFAKPKPLTIVLRVGTDAAGFAPMLPKIRQQILDAWREGIRRSYEPRLKALIAQDTEQACRALKTGPCKIYNIHNKGYRFLGDPSNKTYYD